MKKLYPIWLLLLLAVFSQISCSDDNDIYDDTELRQELQDLKDKLPVFGTALETPDGFAHFTAGSLLNFTLNTQNVRDYSLLKAPQGWKVNIAEVGKYVSVQAPAQTDVNNGSGKIILTAVDAIGNTHLAVLPVIVDPELKLVDQSEEIAVCPWEGQLTFTIQSQNLSNIHLVNPTEDWIASYDPTNNKVSIQAPAFTDKIQSDVVVITVVGELKDKSEVTLDIPVQALLDLQDPDGTYVVCEGNMTSANGTVLFYDKAGKAYPHIFELANNGKEIGNVVQDMYMYNGRTYLLTQNGGGTATSSSGMGGQGRWVVCDSKTMKMIYCDPLEIQDPNGNLVWPQHLVVTDDHTAYVQYSQRGMEATSGICRLDLTDDAVSFNKTVDGTFGDFTTEGATKTRLVYSRGKIYAACGEHVIIVDPVAGEIIKKLNYPGRQIKGIVKAADNNLYFLAAGEFTGATYMPTYTNKPIVYGMNHEGEIIYEHELSDIDLPVATWSPAVGLCASFTSPCLYFVDQVDFSAHSVGCYNYETETMTSNLIKTTDIVYGILGVHPTSEQLWLSQTTYMNATICVYDPVNATSPLRTYHYDTDREASPAGIDFVYRFSDEFIER